MQYKGIIIKESLENREILKDVEVIERTVSEDGEWHMHTVLISPEYTKRIAQNLKEGTWYAHFWSERDVIVVFKDKTFSFNFADKSTWKTVLDYGRSLGIPEEQLDFPMN